VDKTNLNLEIITPGKKIFDGRIRSVKVPGKKGSFSVLRNHAPLISTLDKGTVKIVSGTEETINIEVQGGIIEVKQNKIIILADL